MIHPTALLTTLLTAAPTVGQSSFGYVGMRCGLDGPGEDFAAETPFTNLAQVCPTGDEAVDAANLAQCSCRERLR